MLDNSSNRSAFHRININGLRRKIQLISFLAEEKWFDNQPVKVGALCCFMTRPEWDYCFGAAGLSVVQFQLIAATANCASFSVSGCGSSLHLKAYNFARKNLTITQRSRLHENMNKKLT